MTSSVRSRGNQRCDGSGAAGSGSGNGEVACIIIIVTHCRYTVPSDRRQRLQQQQQQQQSNRQICPNFNRDNFNFSLYKKKNLSCTSSIQDKRKHFFQLPQNAPKCLPLDFTYCLNIFLKLGNSLGLRRCVNARFFLSLFVLLIASGVTRKHSDRPQFEKKNDRRRQWRRLHHL